MEPGRRPDAAAQTAGESVQSAAEGEEVQIILSQTPFYAESGGQIADRGVIRNEQVTATVLDVQKAPNGQNLHRVKVEDGVLTEGSVVTSTVDAKNRSAITKNHTATHLLHQALKDVLGVHVNQAGSLVQPDRLRFENRTHNNRYPLDNNKRSPRIFSK